MTLAYNLGIRVYFVLVSIASVFNHKAKLWKNGRKNLLQILATNIESNSEYAWFHASSLGEFEQGRPIVEALKLEYPDIKIILTFFSPSGYEIRKNYSGADYICYLPLDTRRNAREFIKTVNPRWVFFIKYEYWYHFLKEVHKNNSKLYLVSGIFRKEQLFFKPYGNWYRKMLGFFDHLFVQNTESAELLESIGVKNYTIAGDSRFDRVVQIAEQSKEIEIARKFSEGFKVIVGGSTWEPDEKMLIDYIKSSDKNIKLIIAPHEIHAEHIKQITDKIDFPYSLYSIANDNDLAESRILIIDNIGMLSSIYKYGKVAYIGGGFGVGIHNTLEAAVYGMPVIFGPKYKKFQEALDLVETKGGFSINSSEEFAELANLFFSSDFELKSAGNAAYNYVHKMKGATNILLNYLKHN
jgi:3-deoxy-D-manno-octulosonic-acid transferase